MKYDLMEFDPRMTFGQRAWRVAFLLGCIAVCALDLFVWRP